MFPCNNVLQTHSLWLIFQPNVSPALNMQQVVLHFTETEEARGHISNKNSSLPENSGPCLILDLKVFMCSLYVLWNSEKLKWIENYDIVCLELNSSIKWKRYAHTLCGGQVQACSALFWGDLGLCAHTPQCQYWANKQYWETGCQLHSHAFGQVPMEKLFIINLKNTLCG